MQPARRSTSLRQWLQTSTLLAVLAGYGLLLFAHSSLTDWERRRTHQELTGLLIKSGISQQDHLQSNITPTEIEVETEIATEKAERPTRRKQRGDEIWLESNTLVQLPEGKLGFLIVRQNITDSVQRERTLQLFLIAVAGLSSLFTSALLRPVLRRGLVDPIASLCEQLQQISSPAKTAIPLAEAEQPSELQPIAAAFNAMQQRLSTAWERERTFTDGAAHELRTPITLIRGQAERLLGQPLPDRQRQTVEFIAQEAARMGHLVSDLLSLARQDAGRLQCLLQPVDPEALLLEAFDRLRLLAPERIKVELSTSELLPSVPADHERLPQCLNALMENALAYSSGTVTLSVDSRENHVIWHVQDQGPGVPDAEKTRIFERFVRGSAAADGSTRGSGLGLAVVKLLMEAMNGQVLVRDNPGGGADFQLWLPITP